MKWQLIKTAPKDGTRILLACWVDTRKFPSLNPIGTIYSGAWKAHWRDGYKERWRSDDTLYPTWPTHWKPLDAA